MKRASIIRTSNIRTSIGAFARAQSRARLNRFVTQAGRAAKHPEDPEAIHALRVSIRRFTQCLRTFRGVFDARPLKKLQRRLRKLMDACAAIRTCDVALEVLREADAQKSRSPSLIARLAAARAEAEQRLREQLKKLQRRRAADWELEWQTPAQPKVRAEVQPDVPAEGEWDLERDLPANLRRVLPKLAEDFFAMGIGAAAAGDDHEKLHHFRLRAKHFRYTLELFRAAYGAEWEQGLQALKGLQDRLGAINDCVSTIAFIGHENAPDRRAAAAVKRLLLKREADFQAYWRSEFAPEKRAWWERWLGAPAGSHFRVSARRRGARRGTTSA
jgi:CHAD domain-containing protein